MNSRRTDFRPGRIYIKSTKIGQEKGGRGLAAMRRAKKIKVTLAPVKFQQTHSE